MPRLHGIGPDTFGFGTIAGAVAACAAPRNVGAVTVMAQERTVTNIPVALALTIARLTRRSTVGLVPRKDAMRNPPTHSPPRSPRVATRGRAASASENRFAMKKVSNPNVHES